MKKDLYSVLGVSKSATDEEIRKAFRTLALKYHPDRHTTKSKEEKEEMSNKFREVKEAYDILSDPEKRKMYDTYGTTDPGAAGVNVDDFFKGGFSKFCTGNFGFNSSKFSAKDFVFSGFDAGDFMGFGRDFSDPFQKKKENSTVEFKVSATLDELYTGVSKTLKSKRKAFGTTEDKIMKVYIKPGYKAGTKFTFHGYGDQLPDGSFQDIRLVLEEKPHPVFKRVDDDLEMSIEISLRDLIKGFQKTINLPGNRTYTLTHNDFKKIGDCITIPFLGMPLHKDPSRKGNLRVRSTMTVPYLTSSQRESVLKELPY